MVALLAERPRSPAEGVHFVENFVGNGTITTNLIGQNMWTLTTIGNAGTLSYLTTILTDDPPIGGIRSLTGATADGDGSAVHMLASTARIKGGSRGGGFCFRYRYPSIAGNVIAANDFRIGLMAGLTATAPTDGISVASEGGVLTLRADSADHTDVSQAFAQPLTGRTLTSGTTSVLNVAHQIEVHWEQENGQGGPLNVYAYADGILSASLVATNDDDENVTPAIVHWQDQGGAQSYELDVHFFEYWQFRDYPDAATLT